LAPRGQPPGGRLCIGFLARQCFEIVGQEFVDGGGSNDQALKKGVHGMPPLESLHQSEQAVVVR
jgi:hypothetical protein